jgi:hypothetical protein
VAVTQKPPKVASRQDIEDAVGVLDYLVHDLILAHQLYDIFVNLAVVSGFAKPETEKAARRMYVSYIVLTLQKFSEFWDRYKWLLSDEAKAGCERIVRELRRRGIRGLRHTFIGHVVNEKTGRPITAAQLEAAFRSAIDNDLDGFLRWVHVSGNVASPDTVVGTLSSVHEALRARLR